MSISEQFTTSLKRIKKRVVPWEAECHKIRDKLLCKVGEEIACLFLNNTDGILFDNEVVKLKEFKECKYKLLPDCEAEWHLKRRSIWIYLGNENTRFFHQFSWHRQIVNTILDIQNEEGETMRAFNILATLGVKNFELLFHEPQRVNSVEVSKLCSFFPQLSIEEDN